MANPWDNDPIVQPAAPVAGPIMGAPKPADPYRAEDQQMQRDAAARADAAARRAAAAAERQAAAAERPTLKAGYQWGPDGKTAVPIPGIQPEGEKASEGERKAAFLATNLVGSAAQLAKALQKDPNAAAPTLGQKVMGFFGQDAKNTMLPAQRQVVEDSQLAILDAALTLGTGAAYTREQLEGYRQAYFPQIGDSEEAVAAKKIRLQTAMRAARISAGNAGPQIDEAIAALGLSDPEVRPTIPMGQGEFGGEATQNNPLSAEQQRAYDAFTAANPRASVEQLTGFFKSINFDLDPARAAEMAAATAKGARPAPAASTQAGNAQALKERNDKILGRAGAGDLIQQGASFGLQDEATGVANAAYNAVTAPFTDAEFDPSGSYTVARDASRLRTEDARQRLGVGGTLLEMSGGLLAAPANALAAAPTLGARVGLGARSGAQAGGAAGFGYGEGTEGSLISGALGAAGGAALGAAIPAATQVIGAPIRGLSRMVRRDPSLPRQMVARALDADGNTARSAGQAITEAQGRGSPMALADTGENMRGLLAAVSRQPGPGRAMTREAMFDRQNGQADRVGDAIRGNLGPTSNPYEVAETLTQQARTAAAPLYEQAYQSSVVLTPRVQELLARPSSQQALRRARSLAAEEGRNPDELGLLIDSQGNVRLSDDVTLGSDAAGNLTMGREALTGPQPTMETFDYVKRGLDDIVEGYRDGTSGRLNLDEQGRAVNGTLRGLLGELDRQVPVYAQARRAYAGPSAMKSAMERGLKALDQSADDITHNTRRLSESEMEMWRLGVRRAMLDRVERQVDGADKATNLIGSPRKRQAMARAFGGGANFRRFMDTLADEQAMMRTHRSVTGGSQTAERLAADSQVDDGGLLDEAVDAGVRVGRDGLWATVFNGVQRLREAGRFGVGQVGDETRESLAALLTETDPAVLSEVIRAARRARAEQRVVGRRSGAAVQGTGREAGYLTGNALGETTKQRP